MTTRTTKRLTSVTASAPTRIDLAGGTIDFSVFALPQMGDTLLASYRIDDTLTTSLGLVDAEEPLRADGMAEAIKAALADGHCTYSDLHYRIADVNGEQYGFKEEEPLNRAPRYSESPKQADLVGPLVDRDPHDGEDAHRSDQQ